MKTLFNTKTATKVIATALLLVSLIFSSCKKDAGPKGETGAVGATGPTGATGNANVKNYSITIHPLDWLYSGTYSEWHFNFNVNEASNSAVLGYIISGNGEQALPYVNTVANCRYTMATNLFQTTPFIQFQFTNFTSYTIAPTADQYLYLVIIPHAMVKPNVNIGNYDDVKAAYNLKD